MINDHVYFFFLTRTLRVQSTDIIHINSEMLHVYTSREYKSCDPAENDAVTCCDDFAFSTGSGRIGNIIIFHVYT